LQAFALGLQDEIDYGCRSAMGHAVPVS
jgi:hypothetical protein